MICPGCGKPSGVGRCTSCGAVVPLPGEDAVRERPLDRELDLERRERTPPPVEQGLGLDRRGAPRDKDPAFTEGLKAFTRKLEPQRDPADVLIDQARDLEKAGEPVRAFEALSASLLLRPLDARPVRDLERLAAKLDRSFELARVYGRVLQGRPDHPGAAAIRARMDRLVETADALPEPPPATAQAGMPRANPPPPPAEADPAPDTRPSPVPWTPGPAPALRPVPQGAVIHARIAPLWRRLASWVVDSAIVLAVPAIFLAVAVRGATAGGELDAGAALALRHGPVAVAAVALVAITAFVYLALFGALGGRTVGDRLVGLRAVDARSGRPPAPGRAALRALAAVVGTFAFLSGPMWALFDRRGQALHDKLARTITVMLDAPAV